MLIEDVRYTETPASSERVPYGNSHTTVYYKKYFSGVITATVSKEEINENNDDYVRDALYDALSDEIGVPRKDVES